MKSNVKPNLIETYVLNGTRHYDISFDISLIQEEYEYEQITMQANEWNYSGIVDALVQYKYPIDKMQAVINNYLLEPENEEYIRAFNEMQAWRKEAKEIAKEALLYELH